MADLEGRRVVVRGGSSYAEHARALDRHLREQGGGGLEVVEADPSLATEDLLELVAAGAVEMTFADDYMARAWADVLEGLVVRSDVVLHQGVQIAWAVRPDNPKLLAALDAFARTVRKGSTLGNVLFTRYYENIDRRLANPLAADERQRLARMQELFVRYGTEYDIDWVALAAQAYQESRLDPSRVSPAGAVGVMQLRPSTAAALGFDDIRAVEPNIHAGAKYLASLRDRYFDDEDMTPADRLDFAWAAYNAGPTRVQRLRRLAAERGFDANRWFDHVEQVAAAEVGREPVDYVRNIVKYYVAYRLYLEEEGERRRSLEILHARSG